MIAKKPDNHKVWSAHTRKLTNTNKNTKYKCCWNRRPAHKFSHGTVSCIRNLEFNRKSWEEIVQEIQHSKHDKKCRTKFTHEVRSIEEMQNFKNTEPNQKVRGKYPSNV